MSVIIYLDSETENYNKIHRVFRGISVCSVLPVLPVPPEPNIGGIPMKKLTIAAILIYVLSLVTYAAPGYEPGITGDITPNKDEYKYSETIFLSGEPILMEGTIEIKESSKGTKTTLEYNLANTLKVAKLTRKVTFLNSISSAFHRIMNFCKYLY